MRKRQRRGSGGGEGLTKWYKMVKKQFVICPFRKLGVELKCDLKGIEAGKGIEGEKNNPKYSAIEARITP